VYGGLSLTEFNMRWKGWQNETTCKLEAGTFSSRKELELIIKVRNSLQKSLCQDPKQHNLFSLTSCLLYV